MKSAPESHPLTIGDGNAWYAGCRVVLAAPLVLPGVHRVPQIVLHQPLQHLDGEPELSLSGLPRWPGERQSLPGHRLISRFGVTHCNFIFAVEPSRDQSFTAARTLIIGRNQSRKLAVTTTPCCLSGQNGVFRMYLSTAGKVVMPRQMLIKVPGITAYFWIVKILTTAMGEATSDYLVYHINPYLAVMLGASGFFVALIIQLACRRYNAWAYWLLVVMVSIFGTMVADVIHIVLGVPYPLSTTCFALALAVIFWTWHQVEGTLSIHSIYTLRRELFYWAMVIAAFALGTAAGDMTAMTLHLGYFLSGALFAALFAVAGLCYRRFGLNEIVAFWSAYVLTRPLGASFADGFGKPQSVGGLGYGSGLVSVVLTVLIVIFVGYLAVGRVDVPGRSGVLNYGGEPDDGIERKVSPS